MGAFNSEAFNNEAFYVPVIVTFNPPASRMLEALQRGNTATAGAPARLLYATPSARTK